MIILASDLDGTMVGNNNATTDLMHLLEQSRKAGKVKLVYATGRSLERYKKVQDEERLLNPDALIGAVGTEIYAGPQYELLTDWPKTFENGWDRDAIENLCLKTVDLHLQAKSEQRPYKISFETENPDIQILNNLKEVLSVSFPNSFLLVSHGGQFIDVVPQNSDKGKALYYLAEYWGITPENIVTAGDSANDIALLVVGKAIVVGNAYPELTEWFTKRPDLPVYFAKNNFAKGITEGLEHYFGKNWSEL